MSYLFVYLCTYFTFGLLNGATASYVGHLMALFVPLNCFNLAVLHERGS